MTTTKPLLVHNFSALTGSPGDFVDLATHQSALNEIEELKASIAHQEEILSYIQKVPTEPNEKALAKRVVELEAKVAKYEDALKFYADQKNYSCEEDYNGFWIEGILREVFAGAKAKQALGEK